MTWTKLGDEFADECWTLSDKAFRLHTEGLLWSNRMLTDGQLAKEDMRRWAHHPDAADELVEVGWWEDHGGHFQIIHHVGYQRTKKQIAHQSLVNRANRAKGVQRPVRPKNESSDESSDERARTGQDRKTNWGTSPARAQETAGEADEDYEADYRDWCSEAEREHLQARIDRNVRDGYDR